MQSSEFLECLAAVDTANPDKFQDFLDATQIQPSANLPEYIPIGSHYGVQYFVKSSDIEIPQDLPSALRPSVQQDIFAGKQPTDDNSSAGTPREEYGSSVGTPPLPMEYESSWDTTTITITRRRRTLFGYCFFTARSIPSRRHTIIDLSYGFGIGRLYHKMPDALQPQDTGFYVVCNASDKSIWVAFDFEPYGETGDIERVRPEFGDPYGQLPGDKEELVIGAQKLFSGDWTTKKPLSLDYGDPFKNGAGTPLAAKLFATPAFINEVVIAIKAGRAKQGIGSDLRQHLRSRRHHPRK